MILTSFLITLGLIKCSQLDQVSRQNFKEKKFDYFLKNYSKIPLLKGFDDRESPMDHINVVLQCLYNACPIRTAVFQNYDRKAMPESSGTAISSPLELIFAKMYYDIENNRETMATIYFKESFLESTTTTDPSEFYTWITSYLFESLNYRNLLQLRIERSEKSSNGAIRSEVSTEETCSIFTIQHSASVQAFLKDLFSEKIEETFVSSDEESYEKIISTRLTNLPDIATFLIQRDDENEYFMVEDMIQIEKNYKLNSFVMLEEGKYSACVRGNDSNWYKIQDNSFSKIEDQERVINLASRFGYILFYINDTVTISTCSPKPCQELILKTYTKEMTYGFSKSARKQSNSPQLKSSNSPPSKIKSMASCESTYSPSSCKTIVSPQRSNSQLSLKDLPSRKTPSPNTWAYLDTFLIRRDLSDVKMNLLKIGQVESNTVDNVIENYEGN